jgi:diadenosine tetraphosphatase ApaH/serine/threonine PP2A family protein phosphatase
VVGYGPQPNETSSTVRERADLSLCGNHDLIALDEAGVSLEEFNPDAAAAAVWTRSQLSPDTSAFLSSLHPAERRDDIALFHASPSDPVWEYVLTDEAARRALDLTTEAVVLVGHTHVPIAVRPDGGWVAGGHAREGTEIDLSTGRWLLNPGGVGQPRDGDPRAAYLLLDLTAARAWFRRVAYDVEAAQAAIDAAGLPASLARRLAYGV